MNIGIFTGGGPAPGLNAAIDAVARELDRSGNARLFGFKNGGKGFLEGDYVILTPHETGAWHNRGGSFLGTSRVNLEGKEGDARLIIQCLSLNGFIVVGGNDTARSAFALDSVVGTNLVPKTIDNDVPFTDRTFGCDTFVHYARADADRFVADGETTGRLHITEIMGRDNGTLAFETFVNSNASLAIIPEVPFEINKLAEYIKSMPKPYGLLIVAEGAQDQRAMGRNATSIDIFRAMLRMATYKQQGLADLIDLYLPKPEIDQFGNVKKGDIANLVTRELKNKGIKVQRAPDLGYQYRCADPIGSDILLATRMARHAVRCLVNGQSGIMAALVGTSIESVRLSQVVLMGQRYLDEKEYAPYLKEGGFLAK